MTNAPRYTDLRDYLRVLRQNRLILILCALLFAGAAVALAKRQKAQYRTESSVSFHDVEVEASNLIGVQVNPTATAAQRAQIDATSITRPEILARVATILHKPAPTAALAAGVSAAVDQATGFVTIRVVSTDKAGAAPLANAYAQAVQTIERQRSRGQFQLAARALQSQLHNLGPAANDPYTHSVYADRVTRLKFAAQTADPVQLASFAVAPNTPIFPHPVRDGILGLLLGVTIGVLIAFGRDALDRRLRDVREITSELGWPIVGHISEDVLGHVQLVRANGHGRIEESELEGFGILRQNIQYLDVDHPPRSILVTSAMPEEGKSTVAASLACASALAGKLTLLVECDLRRPSLAKKLGMKPAPGLTDYLLGEAQPSDILQTIPVGESASSNGASRPTRDAGTPPEVAGAELVAIAAGKPTSHPAELLSSQRLRSFIADVSAAYDVVVIDSCPVLSVPDTLELLPEIEAALVCVRASKTTREEVRAVKAALGMLPERPVGVVVTGVPPGRELDFGYYSRAYAYGA